jgi:hypothetical protein
MDNLAPIPPNQKAIAEASELSREILSNIELSDIPLKNIALKASRLARLLKDVDYQRIFLYEASGYPTAPDGVPPDVWKLGVTSGRIEQIKDPKTGNITETMVCQSIESIEKQLQLSDVALAAARDPDVSISSANPSQYVSTPIGNRIERNSVQINAGQYTKHLAKSRSLIYEYTVRRYYELKFSGIADDIFTRTRQKVDEQIGKLLPDALRKFTSVYENLLSDNQEDWANAVHSCRRILQDLADVIFPPTEKPKVLEINGKKKEVLLGQEQYINRIIAFIEDHSDSERFKEIVGSNISYLGNRLDSIFKASQKGSHSEITLREEADRYVIFTYLIVGDVLSLYLEKRGY